MNTDGDAMPKSFIRIETGSSAYTKFKARGGGFGLTEDGIFFQSFLNGLINLSNHTNNRLRRILF